MNADSNRTAGQDTPSSNKNHSSDAERVRDAAHEIDELVDILEQTGVELAEGLILAHQTIRARIRELASEISEAADSDEFSGKARGLIGLPGEAGDRAEFARLAGVALQQMACTLLKMDSEELVGAAAQALFRRIYTLAGVVMSAVDNDDTMESLEERLTSRNDTVAFLDAASEEVGNGQG